MNYRFFLIILINGLLLSFHLHGGETWKIASLNWEPYSSAGMTTQGNSIQKLRALLKQKDITLLVDYYPWERAKKIAREDEYVGYYPAWPEEVATGFTASPAIDWSWIGILKESNTTLDFKNLNDLFKRYKVGLVSSYVYPDEIMKPALNSPENIIYSPNEISLLKMLLVGRQDCAITDPYVMTYLAERDGYGDIETVKILMKKELVIAFRNDEENLTRLKILKSILRENEH